jgi:hypothetical protein
MTTYCPYNVTDKIASNCECHPSYTYASDFKLLPNCVEYKGLKDATTLFELSVYAMNILSVMFVTTLYFKKSVISPWVKFECGRDTDDKTVTSIGNNLTVFIVSTLIALLALVEKILTYVLGTQHPSVGILITIGFMIQIFLEGRYLITIGELIKKSDGVVKSYQIIRKCVIFFSWITTITILAFQFADLRFTSAKDKWIDVYILYGTFSGLVFLLSCLLLAYIWSLIKIINESMKSVSKLQSGETVNTMLKPLMLLVNNGLFLMIRIVIVVLMMIMLGLGPGLNHYTILPIHFSWFVTTLIFIHLLQSSSLEKIAVALNK